MNSLYRKMLKQSTVSRLIAHGLTFSMQETKSDIDSVEYEEEVGKIHTFLGMPTNWEHYKGENGINEYLDNVLDDFYTDTTHGMRLGAVWYPVYDIGLSGHEYTTKQSSKTGWLTLCGVILSDAEALYQEHGVDEMDDKTEALIIEKYEQHLKRLSAQDNNEVYCIEVATDANGVNPTSFKRDYCDNTDDNIDSAANDLIDKTIKHLFCGRSEVTLTLSAEVLALGGGVTDYITKKISTLLGFKLAIGVIKLDEETGTISTYLNLSAIPRVSDIISMTGENLFAGVYREVVKIKEIDVDDIQKQLYLMQVITSADFNDGRSPDYTKGIIMAIFNYVEGVDVSMQLDAETPF